MVFIALYMVSLVMNDIEAEGKECLEDPINYGVRDLEEINNGTVTCILQGNGSNYLIFDGEKVDRYLPEGVQDFDMREFKSDTFK